MKFKFKEIIDSDIQTTIKTFKLFSTFKALYDVTASDIKFINIDIVNLSCDIECLYDGLLSLKCKAEQCEYLDNFNSFDFGMKQKVYVKVFYPLNFEHVLIREILPITFDNTSLYIYTLEFDNFKHLEMGSNMYSQSIFDSIIKVLKNKINKNKISYQQVNSNKNVNKNKLSNHIESCIVKGNINNVWAIISNWINFQSNCKFIPSYLYGSLNFEKENEVFYVKSLNYSKKEQNISGMKVISANNKDTNRKQYVLGCFDANDINKNIKFKIELNLIKVKHNSCYVEFKHIMQSDISYEYKSYFSNMKRDVLLNIQKKT